MSRELETAALILRGVDYGEADRVVTMLTEGRGKITAFARGVKKSKRRFRGGLGAFVELHVTLRDRGEDRMLVLAESEAVVSHAQVGSELPKMAIGTYALELLHLGLQDDQGRELFSTTVRLLRWLAGETRGAFVLEAGLHRFELLLMNELGFLPDLAQCARTGADLDDSAGARWLPGVGIVTLAGRHPGEASGNLPPGTLGYLRGLARGAFPSVDDPAGRRAVRATLRTVWCHVLDRDAKSHRFYAECFA